jgi:Fe-Mn family superoxide dismutase
MTDMSRRNAMGTIALGAAAAAVPLEAGAQTAAPSATVPAFSGGHAPASGL